MRVYNTDIDEKTLKETSPLLTAAFPYRCDCTNIQDYPGKEFPWHWHGEVEILMIVSGKLKFITPYNDYELNAGDIIFATSNLLHCTKAIGDFPGIHKEFIFSPLLIGGSPESAIAQKYVIPFINFGPEVIYIPANHPKSDIFTNSLNTAYEICTNKPEGYELYIRHLMETVWMELKTISADTTVHRPKRTASEERIRTMIHYLEENFSLEITVSDIAATANVSPRECSRCFKHQLGTTPMDYLLSLRINKACEMLQNTDYAISDIAMRCGFSSSSYFTKLFHAKSGVTPRQYRMMLTRVNIDDIFFSSTNVNMC